MDNQIFGSLPLPRSSSVETLETISRNKLSLLFDPSLFEIRPEIQRDKGVDLVMELKQDGRYTNFRFVIQLKATASITPNKDGSISFPVKVSNINYLLNYGLPAYYILYEHKSGLFYLEPVNHVFNNLLKTYKSTRLPQKFTIKFTRHLTSEIIREVHRKTLENGMMLRRLSQHFTFSPADANYTKGILIDSDNQVYSVEQNIEFINQFGFKLLSDAKFAQIVEIEQRTHPRTSASAMFNLVCGVAYFYRSNLFKALELLKLAQQEAVQFEPDIRSMLNYTVLQAKYTLGIINESDFKIAISQILETEELGSFLQLEKANDAYWQSQERDSVRIKKLYESMERILSENPANDKARIIAYAHILEAEAKILIDDLSKNIILLAGKISDYKQTKTFKTWEKLETQFANRLNSVFKYAIEQKDFLSASNLGMDKVRWVYWKTFLNYTLSNWNKNTRTVEGPIGDSDKENLLKNAAFIERIAESYEAMNHTENRVTCLKLKYEMLHLAGERVEADNTAKRIIAIIDDNDFNALRKKFQQTISGGTEYEKFIDCLSTQVDKIYKVFVASNIGQYMLEDIPKSMLKLIEKDIKWSIHDFFEFNFPTSQ